MQFTHFIGIDVSKATLDWCVVQNGKVLCQGQIINSKRAIERLISQLKKQFGLNIEHFLFTAEHTGLYTHFLRKVLPAKKAKFWLVSPLHLSRSLGLQREKSDKIDAELIAKFAYRNHIDFRAYIPVRPQINQIKRLFALRRQLVKTKMQLKSHISEQKFMEAQTAQSLVALSAAPLEMLKKQIKETENAIKKTINSDPGLKQLYKIIDSVNGVGIVLAAKLLIITNEFKTIKEPAKLACLAGVAPFASQSGTSLKTKPKVSPFANKELKYLLHLAALATIRDGGQYQAYYQRRTAQGKHPMKVLNAIRNKLLHCIFACVNQNVLFVRNYKRAS